MKHIFITLMLAFGVTAVHGQPASKSAKEIIEAAYNNERSGVYTLQLSVKIERSNWSREVQLKSWALSGTKTMMLVTNPARDKGIAFLRNKTEGWNWIPSIERVIKISPSQMAQPWMGSDFSNEDLLKEAAIVHDYTHTLVGEETIDNVSCFKVQALPKPSASVTWGAKIIWVGKQDMLERKTENYDEKGVLVSTLIKTAVKPIGGRLIPTVLTMYSNTKPGQHTIVTIYSGDFNARLSDQFFTQENMRKLK